MTTNTLKLIHEYLAQGGYSPGIDSEALEREATLIAAAPDLLAALEELVGKKSRGPYKDINRALDAIAKAKGEA